jgi:hypothetical protein
MQDYVLIFSGVECKFTFHTCVDSSLEVCVPSPSRRSLVDLRIPVLPPSTFLLESFDAKEWIRVQRIKNKQRYNKGMVVRSSRFGSWDAKDHRDLRRSPAVSARSGRDGSHSKKFERSGQNGHKAHVEPVRVLGCGSSSKAMHVVNKALRSFHLGFSSPVRGRVHVSPVSVGAGGAACAMAGRDYRFQPTQQQQHGPPAGPPSQRGITCLVLNNLNRLSLPVKEVMVVAALRSAGM